MMEKKKCIACGQPLPESPLLVLEHMPASAQDIPGCSDLEQDREVTLNLHQCGTCGLVQFDCEPVWYYRDVIRSGGFSTTMVELRRRQYEYLIDKYRLQGKKFIEVGCGRGEFLSVLGQFPVEAYGVEHRADLVELARGQGLKVFQGFTEEEDTELSPAEESAGPYDVFLSFNFLEHQPEPVKMLRCIANNLAAGGMGLLTVPSLEYILRHDGYYELLRDHLAYYTFGTLEYVLAAGGFEVLEKEMINRDTLSVIVQKAERPAKPVFVPVEVSGLAASRETIGREIREILAGLRAEHKRLAVWGASHQGFTLAATTGLKEQTAYIIDSAPFKQGRFAPVSHIPIVAPEYFERDPVETVLIVAPGYTEEIAGLIRERFGAGVDILALKSDHVERPA